MTTHTSSAVPTKSIAHRLDALDEAMQWSVHVVLLETESILHKLGSVSTVLVRILDVVDERPSRLVQLIVPGKDPDGQDGSDGELFDAGPVPERTCKQSKVDVQEALEHLRVIRYESTGRECPVTLKNIQTYCFRYSSMMGRSFSRLALTPTDQSCRHEP